LQVWNLERLMDDYRFSLAEYWRFRAELLLEWWKAEPHAVADLLEGHAPAADRRPFVLVYRRGVELWSRPPRPPMRFREDREAGEAAESDRSQKRSTRDS
jgi:hypothetical protein